MKDPLSTDLKVLMLQWRTWNPTDISRPWCVSRPEEFAGMIDNEDGEIFQVRPVRMTEAEVDALPEYDP